MEQKSCIFFLDKTLFVYGVDSLCLSSPIAETEAFLESEDGQVTTLCSALDSQNIHGDASFTASGETQMDGGKDNSKCSLSQLYDNKNDYSSMVGLC